MQHDQFYENANDWITLNFYGTTNKDSYNLIASARLYAAFRERDSFHFPYIYIPILRIFGSDFTYADVNGTHTTKFLLNIAALNL